MLSMPVSEAFAALDAAVQAVGAPDWECLPVRERIEAFDRLETLRRRPVDCSLSLTGSLDRCGEPALGGVCARVIADVVLTDCR